MSVRPNGLDTSDRTELSIQELSQMSMVSRSAMQNTDRAGTPQETVEDVYHTQNTASMELITEPAGQSLISKGEGAKVMKSSDLES